MSKLSKVLLTIVGVLNLFFGFFHIYLGYAIHQNVAIAAPLKGLMESLNAGGGLMIFFLSYASLLHQKDMMTTELGRAVLALGALLFLSRAAEEFVWFTFRPPIFYSCLAVGLLYAILLLRAQARSQTT